MPEFMPSHDRRRVVSVGVGISLFGAAALGVAVCPREETLLAPSGFPNESPPDHADTPEVRKEGGVRAKVHQEIQITLDDDDPTGKPLPSVSIDPDVFADGMWGLSEVSKCVQAPEDMMVTYPDPNEMRAVSLRDDGQPHVPASIEQIRGEMILKVGRMKFIYELPLDGSQAEIEGRLTTLCRDVRGMAHRTDWLNTVLCQGPDDADCDAYIGELQAEGSIGHRPVEMMDDLLGLLTDGDFFDKIDRYKSHAFRVDPKFSKGLGHFSVMIEHSVIDGEPTLVYSVTSSNVSGFPEFTTPEEVVEFIYRHWDGR